MTRWTAAGMAICWAASACQPEDKTVPIPGAGAAPTHAVVQPRAPAAPAPQPKRPRPSGASPLPLAPVSGAVPNAPVAPQPSNADPAEPPTRDLSAELRALVGDPSPCFAKRAADQSPAVLTLQFHAVVLPSGNINRTSVEGAVSEDERACLAAKVANGRFSGPVEDAPLTVDATVELRQKPQPKPAPAPTPSGT